MSGPKVTSAHSASSHGKKKRSIQMRMYNVGFGDCFLLRIPTEGGERLMLVDCGYHSQGKGAFNDREIVGQIKEDIAGKAIDVVVATHRHQDHISGFGERDLWDDIAVEEVWLPFTADPKAAGSDPTLKAWNSLMESANGLLRDGGLTPAALTALGARTPDEQAMAEFMLWNARANAPGIENLVYGMKRADGRPARRRFLPDEGAKFPASFLTRRLPGVQVHVLGPPRDPQFRKQRKVPASWGVAGGVVASAASPAEGGSPFGPEWRVPQERLPPRRPLADASLRSIRLFNDDLLHAARAVDGFLNGESIVLVLEVGEARLLLPGDAEVGTWQHILSDNKAAALAASATFLKVGHHGSHNATPLVFVQEQLAKKTPAIISTQEGPGNYRNGIPLDGLLAAMKHREMPYARSDKAPKKAQGIFTPGAGGRWIDCEIPC